MAHSCPICDQVCHCKGDIDDIIFDREPKGGCVHYKTDGCDGEDDWDDDYDFEEEDDIGDRIKLKPTNDGGLYDPESDITHYL
jgi:hypothetical protein